MTDAAEAPTLRRMTDMEEALALLREARDQLEGTGLYLVEEIDEYLLRVDPPRCPSSSDQPPHVGQLVKCGTCRKTKQPLGRDAPSRGSYCHGSECDGYMLDPTPGSLWPGETCVEYGFSATECRTPPMDGREG